MPHVVGGEHVLVLPFLKVFVCLAFLIISSYNDIMHVQLE